VKTRQTFYPQGIVPRDLNVGIRMQRLPEAGPAAVAAEEEVTLPPEGGFFLDLFAGGGSLDGRTPDIGGPYAARPGSGALSVAALDGSGNLPLTNDGSSDIYVQSAVTESATTYSLETLLTITGNNIGDRGYFDLAAIDSGSDSWLVEAFLIWDQVSGIWNLYVWVVNSGGSTLYSSSNNVTASITIGSEQSLRIDVSPTGTIFSLDGVVIASTAFIPDVLPDAVVFGIFGEGGTTGKINSITGLP
jgi:hypothetical protein